MISALDSKRDFVSARQSIFESLSRECQQPTQPVLNQLIDYYFQTESSNALQLIKQFSEIGKEQFKVLMEHLNTQGLKPCNRHSANLSNVDLHSHEEKDKVAHAMKVFRILCLIIHNQVTALPALVKDTGVLSSCLQAITKYKDDPNILAQACYFFAALTATLPGEIVQHTDSILNIFKATCKYLYKNLSALRQLSIQTRAHSLENVQLWIVNQSAHALFYTLYTAYPCNFLYHIQREFQRNENMDVFEHIFIPMFQRVRFNRRLIDSDRKRELDKEKRLRQDSYYIIYEARKLSLDPLFGRESPMNGNWMHQEMKRILPFGQFKRQSPTRSVDQLSEGLRNTLESSIPSEMASKRAGSSPFQKIKEKIKSLVRPSSSSTPATTISTPDVDLTSNLNPNVLSVPTASASNLSSPIPALGSDIRAVKTMPELQSTTDLSSSASSTPVTRRSEQQHQVFVKSVVDAISSIYEQNLPSHWRKLLGRYDPSLLTVSTPQRQAIFYVSPSEHSLDNQQHSHQHYDDGSPTSTNEKRQRCASASCVHGQHVHSPVLAAPTTSTEEILPRTQSLSTRQRHRQSIAMGSGLYSKHLFAHQSQFEEDDQDDHVLIDQQTSLESYPLPIPTELYLYSETKNTLIDDLVWNDHDFISIPHFDFNDIVTNNCSSNELKEFDRLYECHSNYEVFLTEQYKKLWEHLWAKQKTYQKHLSDLQTTRAFMDTLQLEVHGHLNDEYHICEQNLNRLSDENSLLGGKVVELSKVTSRRKQSSTPEENNDKIRELEKACEQLRKTVNNETLKLTNLRTELDDNEKEIKLSTERLEQLKVLTQNVTHLNDLNQQLECQYLRFTDNMQMTTQSQLLTSNLSREFENDDEQHQLKLTSSTTTTTNGHDEQSEIDSVSFNEENREETEDLQPSNDGVLENYDQLLMDIIDTLTNQNANNHWSRLDIENQAYDILLEYMESKANMQNYLIEHNTRYMDLYVGAQQDYIVQIEREVVSNQSLLEQMQNVAI